MLSYLWKRDNSSVLWGALERADAEIHHSILPTNRQRFDRLTKALGVNSKAEVVRKAVNVLRYLLKEQKCGGTLVVENKREKTRKQLIPI